MKRINRPGDDFREKLLEQDIQRICEHHSLPAPREIVPEDRGNENVAYHLDGRLFLAFSISDDIRRKVDVLRVFAEIDAMPTPRVVAWLEHDAKLGVPYMLLERCPGVRLDLLWESSGHQERKDLLEALGKDMAHYHTVSLPDAQAAGDRVSLGKWVVDAVELRRRKAHEDISDAIESLERLPARLRRLGVDAFATVRVLKAHDALSLVLSDCPSVEPGLIHGEPFAEHFFVEKTEGAFRLSGCVDLEEVMIADAFDEIVSLYVQMLALNREFFAAFKRGYECYFKFPPDAEERLRLAAIGHDLGNILWLLNAMESGPKWAFATPWVEGHLRRLEGWLDESKRIDRALFRKDIGPW